MKLQCVLNMKSLNKNNESYNELLLRVVNVVQSLFHKHFMTYYTRKEYPRRSKQSCFSHRNRHGEKQKCDDHKYLFVPLLIENMHSFRGIKRENNYYYPTDCKVFILVSYSAAIDVTGHTPGIELSTSKILFRLFTFKTIVRLKKNVYFYIHIKICIYMGCP